MSPSPSVGEGLIAFRVRLQVHSWLRRPSTRRHRIGREVLGLMAEGLSGREIAERLIVALPTVKTHQARLYEKLGVSERAAAVAEAMRRGLLE